MKKLLPLLFACSLLLVPTVSQARDPWNRVESKNFLLVGNASTGEMKNVAAKLEQFRVSLTTLFPGLTVETPTPTRVYVFNTDDDLKPFKPLRNGKTQDNVAAYFYPTPDLNYIALSTDSRYADPLHPVYHEYEHFILHLNLASIPLWLNEGLAEFYSTFSASDSGGKAVVGKPINYHISTLNNSVMIPLPKLFAVNHRSPEYNESSKQTIFYAQSWALVHYLIFQDALNKTNQLAKFIANLRTEMTVEEAFQNAFGRDFKAMEKELQSYLRKFTVPILNVSFAEKLPESKDMAAGKTTEAETEFYAGDLSLQMGRLEDAEKHLVKALTLDPKLATAQVALGTVRWRQKRIDEAKQAYQAAIAADPTNHQGYYYRAIFLAAEGAQPDAIAMYKKAIELRPNSAPAHSRLADLYVRLGDDEAAIKEYAAALRADNRNAGNYQSTAYAHLRVGRGAVAALAAQQYLILRGWDDEFAPYMVLAAVLGYRGARQSSEADKLLQTASKRFSATEWPAPVYRYLRGEIAANELMGLATDNDKLTEAHAYLGLDLAIAGKKAEAREHLEWVVKNGPRNFVEVPLASAELKRIGGGTAAAAP